MIANPKSNRLNFGIPGIMGLVAVTSISAGVKCGQNGLWQMVNRFYRFIGCFIIFIVGNRDELYGNKQ